MNDSSGVRKGLWTEEEDKLLRQYIEKHGEKYWFQVPRRAGLNRCRKSCRLRWLNYLKPNIKRGEFETDEIDLILRLHKLLGNRWSLIAGRLPGRTANDVKNYWNTHLRKRSSVSSHKEEKESTRKTAFFNVIKPRPWTLSKNYQWFKGNPSIGNGGLPNHDFCKPSPSVLALQDNESMWWDSFSAGKDFYQAVNSSSKAAWSGDDHIGNLWEEDEALHGFWNDFSVEILSVEIP